MDMPLLVSSVESQLWGFCSWFYRASWLAQGVSPGFAYCPTFSVLKRSSCGFSASGFRCKSSRWGHPSGSSLSQSSIGTKALLPPSWCMVRVFAMGSPLSGRGLSQISIGTKTCWRTFPCGWCLAFAMGSPILGQVALFCALDRNEGFFYSSILSCFAMGSPCGSCGWFLALDRNEAVFG